MNIFDRAKAEMEDKIPVGTRVRYIGDWKIMKGVTGIVTKHYPGFLGDFKRDSSLDSVAIKVDKKPEFWGYSGDTFSPDVSEVEIIS